MRRRDRHAISGRLNSSAQDPRARLWDGLAHPGAVADGSKDYVADGGCNYCRRKLSEANWSLRAVEKLNIEFGDLADAKRRIGVEIGVLHLASNEFRTFVQRHGETPKGAALDLSGDAPGSTIVPASTTIAPLPRLVRTRATRAAQVSISLSGQ